MDKALIVILFAVILLWVFWGDQFKGADAYDTAADQKQGIHPDIIQVIIEKIQKLPPDKVTEVEDFVDFLTAREEGGPLSEFSTRASEAAFAAVWDNADDAEFDRL